MNEATLPSTLSGLLTVAIEDAESLDRDKYNPTWRSFHNPFDIDRPFAIRESEGRCNICLAGAVLAGTLGMDKTEHYVSIDSPFDETTNAKIDALDAMRMKDFERAANLLDIAWEERSVTAMAMAKMEVESWYFNGWEQFDEHLKSLKKARDILQDAGM